MDIIVQNQFAIVIFIILLLTLYVFFLKLEIKKINLRQRIITVYLSAIQRTFDFFDNKLLEDSNYLGNMDDLFSAFLQNEFERDFWVGSDSPFEKIVNSRRLFAEQNVGRLMGIWPIEFINNTQFSISYLKLVDSAFKNWYVGKNAQQYEKIFGNSNYDERNAEELIYENIIKNKDDYLNGHLPKDPRFLLSHLGDEKKQKLKELFNIKDMEDYGPPEVADFFRNMLRRKSELKIKI